MDENRTILETLLEIKENIGSVNSTLVSIKEKLIEQDSKTNHLSSRVYAIETQQQKWKWTMAGAVAVCVGLFKAIELWFTHGGNHQ